MFTRARPTCSSGVGFHSKDLMVSMARRSTRAARRADGFGCRQRVQWALRQAWAVFWGGRSAFGGRALGGGAGGGRGRLWGAAGGPSAEGLVLVTLCSRGSSRLLAGEGPRAQSSRAACLSSSRAKDASGRSCSAAADNCCLQRPRRPACSSCSCSAVPGVNFYCLL